MPDDEKPEVREAEKHRLIAKAADIATNVMNESAKAMKDESEKIDAGQVRTVATWSRRPPR